MVWNGFCTPFFSIVQYRGRKSKKINFSKKKLEKFEIFKWSELDFAL